MKPIISTTVFIILILASITSYAFKTANFSSPYGVAVDPTTNYIYVSNMNGDPNSRDNNGYISRLRGDGTIEQLRFVDGASKKIQLHSPKGMAIANSILYVADIDKIHAFDLASGNFLFDVNFGNLPVQHFYDVKAVREDGNNPVLYVVDGPGNTIYRVDIPKKHEVTTLVSGESLGQPHSLAWFTVRQSFAVAGWSSGQVTAFDRAGKRQPFAAIFLRTLEGLDADDTGNLYVASSALNAIYKIAPNFALSEFQLGLSGPAGIAFHKAGSQIIVALPESGTVQSIPLKPSADTRDGPPPEFLTMPSPVGSSSKK